MDFRVRVFSFVLDALPGNGIPSEVADNTSVALVIEEKRLAVSVPSS
jgi:hypothetical protein